MCNFFSPKTNISAGITFKRLLHLIELKIETGVLYKLTGASKLFNKGKKLVMITTIVIELYLTNELNSNALMLQAIGLSMEGYVDLFKGFDFERYSSLASIDNITFPVTFSPS